MIKNYVNAALSTFDIQIEALKKVKSMLDDDFNKVINLIFKSDLFILTGVGKSGYIGKKISATLNSYGIKSVFLDPVESLHGDLGIASKGDTIILISKSGSTEELIKLFPFLKKRELKIISITGNPESFLSKNSDYNLDISVDKESCPLNLAPTSSTTTSLVMGDAITAALVESKGITKNNFAINHPSGQLGRNQSLKVSYLMKKGEQIPNNSPDDTIKDAIIEITKFKIGATLIIKNDLLIGILTDGDVRRLLVDDDVVDIKSLKISATMTQNPISISSEKFLGEALALMENRQNKISILPVVDNNVVKGIISIHDIYGDSIS